MLKFQPLIKNNCVCGVSVENVVVSVQKSNVYDTKQFNLCEDFALLIAIYNQPGWFTLLFFVIS